MMRHLKILTLAVGLFALAGCASASHSSADQRAPTAPGSSTAPSQAASGSSGGAGSSSTVSLNKAEATQNSTQATERKILRNADLTIETGSPAEAQKKVSSVFEARGGFVVSSDSVQRTGNDRESPALTVTIVGRVPAAQFDATIGQIRAAGDRVTAEKITGDDVTEEFIDLEARLKTERALEAQLLEIMKRANQVSDVLQVQRELATVRTEIERLEGRQRFLENHASLSTITVHIESPAPLVSTSGFFYSLRRAVGDGVDAAATITLFLVRVLIGLVPIVLLIFVPIGLILRYLRRRLRRTRVMQKLAQDQMRADADKTGYRAQGTGDSAQP